MNTINCCANCANFTHHYVLHLAKFNKLNCGHCLLRRNNCNVLESTYVCEKHKSNNEKLLLLDKQVKYKKAEILKLIKELLDIKNAE